MNMRIPPSVRSSLSQAKEVASAKLATGAVKLSDQISNLSNNVFGKSSSKTSSVTPAPHPGSPSDASRSEGMTTDLTVMKKVSNFLSRKKEVKSEATKDEGPIGLFTRTRERHMEEINQRIDQLAPGDDTKWISRQLDNLKNDCASAMRINLGGNNSFVKPDNPILRFERKVDALIEKFNAKKEASVEESDLDAQLEGVDPILSSLDDAPIAEPVEEQKEEVSEGSLSKQLSMPEADRRSIVDRVSKKLDQFEESRAEAEAAEKNLESVIAEVEAKHAEPEVISNGPYSSELEDLNRILANLEEDSARINDMVQDFEKPQMSSVLDPFTGGESHLSAGKVSVIRPEMITE